MKGGGAFLPTPVFLFPLGIKSLSNPQDCDSPSVSVPVPDPAKLSWAFWGHDAACEPSEPLCSPGKAQPGVPGADQSAELSLGCPDSSGCNVCAVRAPLTQIWRVPWGVL